MEVYRILNRKIFALLFCLILFSLMFFYKEQNNRILLEKETSNNAENIKINVNSTQYFTNEIEISKCYNLLLNEFKIQEKAGSENPVLEAGIIVKETYTSDKDSLLFSRAYSRLKEHVLYINNYSETIINNCNKVETLLKNNLLNSGFARSDMLKSRYDFIKLVNTPVKYDNSKAFDNTYQFRFTNYIILIFLIFIVFQFLDERKKGLWELVYATPSGRGRITLIRGGILFASSVAATFLTYGGILILSFRLYGGIGDMTGIVQSSESFQNCLFVVSRWEMFILSNLVTAVCLFSFALILWLILISIRSNNVSIIVLCLFLGFEFILFKVISVKSIFVLFKYINIFQLLNSNMNLSMYKNWGYGDWITDLKTSTLILSIVITIMGIVTCVIVGEQKKPNSKKNILDMMIGMIGEYIDRILYKMPLLIKELYKILISQKGILVIIIGVIIIQNNHIHRGVILDHLQIEKDTFYKAVGNKPMSENTYEFLNEYENSIEELKRKESKTVIDQEIIEVKETVFKSMKDDVTYLENLKEDRNIVGFIIRPYEYNELFGERLYDNQDLVGSILIITIILLFFGIVSYENKNNMVVYLKSSYGREKIFLYKYLTLLFLLSLIFMIYFGLNILNILQYYDVKSLNAPIQSLQLMQRFPLSISIGSYIVLMYFVRLISILFIGTFIFHISVRLRYINSLIVSFLLVLPAMVYMFGIKQFYYFSIINYLNISSFWNRYNGSILFYLPYLCLSVFGIINIFCAHKKWNRK